MEFCNEDEYLGFLSSCPVFEKMLVFRRQRLGDGALRRFRIRRLPYCSQCQDLASPLVNSSQ